MLLCNTKLIVCDPKWQTWIRNILCVHFQKQEGKTMEMDTFRVENAHLMRIWKAGMNLLDGKKTSNFCFPFMDQYFFVLFWGFKRSIDIFIYVISKKTQEPSGHNLQLEIVYIFYALKKTRKSIFVNEGTCQVKKAKLTRGLKKTLFL